MVRMLVDTRDGEGSPTRGIGIDREMALAVYRIGSRDEFAEVPFTFSFQTAELSAVLPLTE